MINKNLVLASVPLLLMGLYLGTGDKVMAQERREKGSLVIEGVPEVPPDLAERMQQYLDMRSATAWAWDPCGKGILIFTRFGDTTQVHRVARPGAYREQLTFFSEPVNDAVVNPNAAKNSFLMLKDVGGSENYQIFWFDMSTGRSKMLSNGRSRYGSLVWSNSGEKFAYQSTQRNGQDWDLWVADPQHPEQAKIVYTGKGHWSPLAWSADDSKLLVGRYVSITNSTLHLLDLTTGNMSTLVPSDAAEDVSVGTACFARNGQGAFYTSDENCEFRRLYYRDLADGSEHLLTGSINWDVESLTVSKDGRYLAFSTNEDGINKVYLRQLMSEPGANVEVKDLPVGVVTGLVFSADGNRLAVSMNGAVNPGDAFVVDTQSREIERWTFSETGGLDRGIFVEPSLVHYPTFDNEGAQKRTIPAFVFMPKNAKGPVPVVINIHGGPESQFQPYFSSITQYMVNEMGIAVVAPNVRGSAGYGKTYVQLDNGFKREDSVKDIGSLLDWIAAQPQLDSSRVAVMGGSYGGFMTLSSMTHYNDRLKAGIDNVGISNFVTFLKNTQDYRRDLRRAEYGDERDPEMYKFFQEIAPANNAHKISIPLFVVQGKNDPRVPVTEAEQMVQAIRKNGSEVWYLMATDEGHGFAKKTNRDYYLQSVVMFLEKHLLGK